MPNSKFFQNTIAIVYDFDGTLSPQPMQEYTVLPKIGIRPEAFWHRVNRESEDTVSESMLVYMRLLLEIAHANQVHIRREDFRAMARQIEYFPGVKHWFDRVDAYVKARSKSKVKIQHYIISSGMKEILEGISIRGHFREVYASEYHFNFQGIATFPKLLITDTSKTQYLFRVNKGKEKLGESINEHMPEYQRPIPFCNMIYIGDGMTDVPSMALAKKNGGHTIAVYNPKKKPSIKTCVQLLQANRVDFIAPADYTRGSKLSERVELLLDSIITHIAYEKEVFDCKMEHRLLPNSGQAALAAPSAELESSAARIAH
jgi:2-hydroxy-3-keto-5-methylthiopentenyl-1-phosphate phosphatase